MYGTEQIQIERQKRTRVRINFPKSLKVYQMLAPIWDCGQFNRCALAKPIIWTEHILEKLTNAPRFCIIHQLNLL